MRYLILFNFCFHFALFGQNSDLMIGSVISENGNPIEGVKVSILGIGYDITTTSGEFRIPLTNNLKTGDKVRVFLSKEGWEYSNIDDLDIIIPANFILNPVILKMRENLVYKKSPITESESKRIKLVESLELKGGRIIMDITALNIGNEPIVLNKVRINSNSPDEFMCKSGAGDGIDISAHYKISFHVSRKMLTPLNPPLLVQPNKGTRFIVELTPYYTGACSRVVQFAFNLEFLSGENQIAKTSNYEFTSDDLELSERNSINHLRQLIERDSSDVFTMRRLINALGCCIHQEEKILLWKKIIAILPNDLDSYTNLAATIDDDDFPYEVVYFFEKAIELDNNVKGKMGYNVLGAYENVVKDLIHKKEYNRAQSIITQMNLNNPNASDFYYLDALIYSKTEKFDCTKAISSLNNYISFEEKYLKEKNWLRKGRFFNWLESKLENDLKSLTICPEIINLLDELKKTNK